ncbi:MAG: hypothetical protein S4CHLAM102_14140 [Chlamydiia bacterium]|nr:hypothetical protein [Chlamydiia bacterium]
MVEEFISLRRQIDRHFAIEPSEYRIYFQIAASILDTVEEAPADVRECLIAQAGVCVRTAYLNKLFTEDLPDDVKFAVAGYLQDSIREDATLRERFITSSIATVLYFSAKFPRVRAEMEKELEDFVTACSFASEEEVDESFMIHLRELYYPMYNHMVHLAFGA